MLAARLRRNRQSRRTAASIAAVSIFFIVIMASNIAALNGPLTINHFRAIPPELRCLISNIRVGDSLAQSFTGLNGLVKPEDSPAVAIEIVESILIHEAMVFRFMSL